jgi:hypothetical protein
MTYILFSSHKVHHSLHARPSTLKAECRAGANACYSGGEGGGKKEILPKGNGKSWLTVLRLVAKQRRRRRQQRDGEIGTKASDGRTEKKMDLKESTLAKILTCYI